MERSSRTSTISPVATSIGSLQGVVVSSLAPWRSADSVGSRRPLPTMPPILAPTSPPSSPARNSSPAVSSGFLGPYWPVVLSIQMLLRPELTLPLQCVEWPMRTIGSPLTVMVLLPSTSGSGPGCLVQATRSVTRAAALPSKVTLPEPVLILPQLLPMLWLAEASAPPRLSPPAMQAPTSTAPARPPVATVAATIAPMATPTASPATMPQKPDEWAMSSPTQAGCGSPRPMVRPS